MKKAKASASKDYSCKGKVLGIILTLFCDCAFLTTCTLVKVYNLKSAEVCFVRGILQISVFLFLYTSLKYCLKCSKTECDNQEDKHNNRNTNNRQHNKRFNWKLTIVMTFCSLSFGAMTLLSYISVKLIPLSDFVIFGHTAPVFTLILSAIILRYIIYFINKGYSYNILFGW